MMRLTALVVFLGLAAPSGAQEPHRFLSTHGTLTETELASVDSGAVVVKVLPASVKNELAILGTARIRATTEFFLRMYRDIERFETGWGVTKKLSVPPGSHRDVFPKRTREVGATSLLPALLLGFAFQGVTPDSILIGMEGPASSFSVDEENLGMRLVILQANDEGGVHGRKLAERSYSRGSDPVGDPLSNAKRLVEKDGVFLLFNFGGPASVPLGAYAMEARVPYLFPHTALLTLDGARYVFTSFPRFEGETRVVLRHLSEKLGVKRIGVIHDPNAYGSYFRDRARGLASELSYRFVGSREIGSRDPETAAKEMAELAALEPDAVILALYPAQARKVMEAKAELGWKEVRMVATGPLTDEQYLDVGGGVSEGTLGFCHYPDPDSAKGPGLDEYRALMKKYFPEKRLNRYSLYGYVFGKLIVEGLERAGPGLTRESFLDAMESIRDWDSGGILPKVSFGKTDHHAQSAGFLCELVNGKFEPRTDWIAP